MDDNTSNEEQLPEGVSLPDGAHLPPIPQPGRRSTEATAIPFDPAGFAILRTLEEVEQKPPKASEGVATAGQIADARRKTRFVPKFSSLESMYAANPMLVTSGKLRIERLQPQWYDDEFGSKMRVNGVLAFKHPIIDDEEFSHKFGGFRYRVFGLLDQENRENLGGPPKATEIGVAEFDLPLPPNTMNLPIADGGGMPTDFSGATPDMNYSPYGRRPGAPLPYPGQPSAPDPYGPMLSFAERAMASRNEGLPPAAWEVIGRQNENAVSSLRDSATQQAQMLMEQVNRLERQLENERAAAREMANKPNDINQMVDGMSRLVASTKGNTDSDVIRQMRDDHDRIVRHLQQDHEQSLNRIREEFERTNARTKEESDRALAREREYAELRMRALESRSKDLENQLATREQEWRNEAERRESRARQEMTQLMEMREREHARVLEMNQSAHTRELQSIKEMHDRELRTHQTVHDSTRTTGDQAHAIEMRSLQTDLAKATAELEEKRRLVKQYEAEKNKPLLDQLREHKDTIDAVTELAGGGNADDDDDKEDAGEEKWWNSPMARQVAGALVSEGVKHVPAIAEKLKANIDRPASAAVVQDRQGPRMGSPPARRSGALPPRRTARIQFADSDGPRVVGPAEDLPRPDRTGDVSTKSGAPRPFDAGSPTDDDDMFQPSGGNAPSQPQAPMQPAPSPQRRKPAARQAAPATPPAQPAAAAPSAAVEDWSAFAWLPMSEEDVKNFVTQMDFALRNGGTAEQLGDAFLTHYPAQEVQKLIDSIDIKQFIESIRQCPMTSSLALAQGRGRRFLADTWAYLDSALSQTAPADAPTSEPPPQAQSEDGGDDDEQDDHEEGGVPS